MFMKGVLKALNVGPRNQACGGDFRCPLRYLRRLPLLFLFQQGMVCCL
jgi:hypothetical protein